MWRPVRFLDVEVEVERIDAGQAEIDLAPDRLQPAPELPLDRLARRSAASLGTPEAEAIRNQELLQTKGSW
jgi:hypothetical protein